MRTILMLILIFSYVNVFTQIDCPPSDEGCTPYSDWQTFSYEEDRIGYQSGISIQYKSRTCNGKKELLIDYSSLQATGNYVFLSESTKYNMILQQLVLLSANNRCDLGMPPNEVVIYKSNICVVKLKCKIQVNPDIMICDTGFDGTPPISMEIIDGQEVYFYYKYWHQSCGDVCCQTIYKVCKVDNLGRMSRLIDSVIRSNHPDSECSLEGDFIDFETQSIINCSSYCE